MNIKIKYQFVAKFLYTQFLIGFLAIAIVACGGDISHQVTATALASDVGEPNSVTPKKIRENTKPAPLKIYDYKILQTYPHDEGAFTQGLFFHDGYLYESTGLNGQSSLRKIEPESGRVIEKKDIDTEYFGEGAVNINDTIVSLTWRAGLGFVHGLSDFAFRHEFDYEGEGWGLTFDGKKLILSDGTPVLRFIDSKNFELIGSVEVTLNGKPIRNLNELEWIETDDGGLLYANIWQTDWIAMIDIESGRVTGLINMSNILPVEDVVRMQRETGRRNVLNGIAWDSEGERLFVTGKNWPKLYEISINLREVQ